MLNNSTKGILTGDVCQVNAIRPHKNKWAWDLYLKGCANNWRPSEIPMAKDIQQWKAKDVLTEDERLLIKRCIGFFAGAESLVNNNLLINIYGIVRDGECRQYIGRQVYEELVHNEMNCYICDSLNLDVKEVFQAYQNIKAIKIKDDFLMESTRSTKQRQLDETELEYKQRLLTNIFVFYIIAESIFFYSGFAMLLALGRQNKMPGISEQIQYLIRDEQCHIEFGLKLINKIKQDYPEIWTKIYQEKLIDLIKKAVEIELQYVDEVLPRGILGLNKNMFVDYMQFIANRRFESIGLNFRFPKDSNPLSWMSETIELSKNKNFFETRVTEYQVGGIEDDL